MGQNICSCPEPVRHTLPKEIWEAALNGDIEKVLAWLTSSNIVNAATADGSTLLLAAVSTGQAELLRGLVSSSSSLHFNTHHDFEGVEAYTPLWVAAAKGHLECVRIILDANISCKPDLIGSKKKDFSAAMIASEKGHWSVVVALLQKFNEKLSAEETAFIFPRAARELQWEVTLKLLPQLHLVESEVVQPLLYQAYEKDQWAVVATILEKNYRYKYESLNRVLSKTVRAKNWKRVGQLLQMMREPLSFDSHFIEAVVSENLKEVNTLLEIKFPSETSNGNFVVIAAAGTSDVIANLIYNSSTYKGEAVESALFLSALNGHLELLQLFFQKNPNYSFSYHCLSRAQQAATESGHHNADRLLSKILDKEAETFALNSLKNKK